MAKNYKKNIPVSLWPNAPPASANVRQIGCKGSISMCQSDAQLLQLQIQKCIQVHSCLRLAWMEIMLQQLQLQAELFHNIIH